VIEAENARYVEGLVRGPDYDKIFLDKKGFFDAVPPEKLSEEMTVRAGEKLDQEAPRERRSLAE
jgi:hypothetical protein